MEPASDEPGTALNLERRDDDLNTYKTGRKMVGRDGSEPPTPGSLGVRERLDKTRSAR